MKKAPVWTLIQQVELLKVSDYRDFLNRVLPTLSLSQATLNRRAGFSSRSFLSELLKGKKGLSRDSLARLKMALRLPKPWGLLFECMVWKTELRIRPTSMTDQDIDLKLQSLRCEIESSLIHGNAEKIVAPHIRSPQVFQVYAALGDQVSGADCDEIIQRTGLRLNSVKKALDQLLSLNTIRVEDHRYFAVARQADALQIENSEDLADMIGTICADLQKNRQKITVEPTNLTVYSAFSVEKKQLPLLKKKLQEAVFDVLDEFQKDRGDHVQQIFISLHGKPMELN